MRAITAVLIALTAAALLWNAGEWHYRNCLNAAKTAHIGTVTQRIDGCSRLPW